MCEASRYPGREQAARQGALVLYHIMSERAHNQINGSIVAPGSPETKELTREITVSRFDVKNL